LIDEVVVVAGCRGSRERDGCNENVTVTVENRGTETWTDGFRLASAPGCPDAAYANAVAWEPTSGYANDLLDARVFLPHAVAPGETVEIHVPVRAPAEPGEYTFAARMVHEGVGWFGPTARATLTVSARGGDGTGSGDDDHQSGASGGCSTSGGASAWLVLALPVLRRRRRSF
jgi:hypothetical protein